MRIVLWILLLLGLAFAVSRYHSRFLSDAREERDSKRRQFRDAEGLPDGYGHAIVGEASGAPIVESAPSNASVSPGPRKIGPPQPSPTPAPRDARVDQHVVGSGESLSKICAAHYGSGRAEIVNAVAKYNRIERVDAIREGQTIQLPPLDTILPPR